MVCNFQSFFVVSISHDIFALRYFLEQYILSLNRLSCYCPFMFSGRAACRMVHFIMVCFEELYGKTPLVREEVLKSFPPVTAAHVRDNWPPPLEESMNTRPSILRFIKVSIRKVQREFYATDWVNLHPYNF
jgi:hypothetical protein